MLFLLLFGGFTTALAYSNSMSDGYSNDGQKKTIVMSEPARDNLILRSIRKNAIQSLPNLQHTFNVHKMRDSSLQSDSFDFLGERELRRSPVVKKKEKAEEVNLKDPEIMKIMDEMNGAKVNSAEVLQKEVTTVPSIVPHFKKSMYDVEVLPREYTTALPLTLIPFISPQGEPPKFSISLDPFELIQIGKVRSKQKGDRLISSVTVELKPNVEERIQKITNGSYAFAVKGEQGDREDVTMIRVKFHPIVKNMTTTTPIPSNSSSRTAKEEETFNKGVVEILTPILTFATKGVIDEIIYFDDTIQVGEILSDFNFTVLRDGEDQTGTISLKTDEEELLMPTPRHITPGKIAHLIVADRETFFEQKNLEITLIAELFGERITRRLKLRKKEKNEILITEKKPKEEQEVEGSGEWLEVNLKEMKTIGNETKEGKVDEEPTLAPIKESKQSDETLPIIEDKIESKEKATITKNETNGEKERILIVDNEVTAVETLIDHSVQQSLVKKLNENEAIDRKQWNMMSVEASISQSTESDQQEIPLIKVFSFSVPESAKSGTIVGEINDLDKYFMTDDEKFSLQSSQLVVSCENEDVCLDYEKENEYKLLLLPRNEILDDNDFLIPIEVTVKVEDINEFPPKLRAFDSMIRIADGELIMPFAIEIDDEDSGEENVLSIEGTAADFLTLSKIDKKLYEIKTNKYPLKGSYTMKVILKDRTGKFPEAQYDVKVLVANTKSRAHFRHQKYEKLVKAELLKKDSRLAEPELEGIPIDSIRFVILSGNPGWLKIDDYHGHILVSNIPENGFPTAKHLLRIGAVNRENDLVMAECDVEIEVLEGNSGISPFGQPITIISKHRENEEPLAIPLMLSNGEEAEVESVDGIDENGMRIKFDEAVILDKHLVIPRSIFGSLRTVHVELSNRNHKASTTIHLTSTPEYLEKKRKEANQPVFIHPWTKEKPIITREIREEEPLGTIVFALPANNPMTGKMVSIKMTGKDARKFTLDQETGSIFVNARLDFDSLTADEREMEIILEAGEKGYTSTATINLILIDLDDNAPQFEIEKPLGKISLPEHSPSKTQIMSVKVNDKDEISKGKQKYTILGYGVENFELKEINSSAVLTVAANANLDRETLKEYNLMLLVEDPAGNRDTLYIEIALTDKNDHRPMFDENSYDIEVIEHWPPGTYLNQIVAKDFDENQSITYTLQGNESEHFSIDLKTGILKIAKSLDGLGRDQPYEFTIMATDNGKPPSNSSVPLRIKVSLPKYILEHEKNQINFILPEHDFVLEIPEGTEKGTVIYNARAVVKTDGNQTSKNIRYSATPLNVDDEGYFDIDEDSGDILVTGGIDYERKQWVTLLLKAESLLNENLTDERLLRVKVVDIDDNPPEFVENKHQIFRVDLSSFNGTKKIGKLLAVDKDERPNDRFTYHLIPECNPRLKTLLKVDQKTGDLSLSGEIPVNVQDLEIFCALVSPIDHPDLNALAFDSQNASMTRLQVKFLKDDHEKAMALKFYPNNTILTIDPDLVNLKFPLISPYHIPDGITFERGNVDFEPALYASPMSSNWSSSIFSIDSQTGALRVSPLIITVNDQGIFKISVNAIDKKTRQPIAQFTQNVHLIDDEEKLKFVFEMGPAELAYNGERLLRKLADALISEDPEKEIDIVGDKIEKYPGEKMRSSICVHAAKDGRLLSRNDLLGIVSSALQKSTSSLQNLYHIFKVINVESCDTVSYQRPLESANPLSQSFMLMLCVICVVLLFVWALFAYYCFVHRYRLYLDEKQRAAQGLDKKSYPSSTLPPPPIPPHYLPNLPPIY